MIPGDEFGEPIIAERKIRIGAQFQADRGDSSDGDDNQADDARACISLWLYSDAQLTCLMHCLPCQCQTKKMPTSPSSNFVQ